MFPWVQRFCQLEFKWLAEPSKLNKAKIKNRLKKKTKKPEIGVLSYRLSKKPLIMALIQYLLIHAFPEAVVHSGCGILFINNETFGSRIQNLTVQLWEFLCNSRCILPLTYALFWHQNQKPNIMRKIWKSKCRIHFCLQSTCHIRENQRNS